MAKLLNKIKVEITNTPKLYLDLDLFEGTLEEISERILNIRQKLLEQYVIHEEICKKHKEPITFAHPNTYEDIKLTIEDHYEGCADVILRIYRTETDEECIKRRAREKEARRIRKEGIVNREKALLAELKAKYDE